MDKRFPSRTGGLRLNEPLMLDSRLVARALRDGKGGRIAGPGAGGWRWLWLLLPALAVVWVVTRLW